MSHYSGWFFWCIVEFLFRWGGLHLRSPRIGAFTFLYLLSWHRCKERCLKVFSLFIWKDTWFLPYGSAHRGSSAWSKGIRLHLELSAQLDSRVYKVVVLFVVFGKKDSRARILEVWTKTQESCWGQARYSRGRFSIWRLWESIAWSCDDEAQVAMEATGSWWWWDAFKRGIETPVNFFFVPDIWCVHLHLSPLFFF